MYEPRGKDGKKWKRRNGGAVTSGEGKRQELDPALLIFLINLADTVDSTTMRPGNWYKKNSVREMMVDGNAVWKEGN